MYTALAGLHHTFAKQFVACTATADAPTLLQIRHCLQMDDSCVVICMPTVRPNMTICVVGKRPKAAEHELVCTIADSPSPRVTVFCRTKMET